MNCIELARHADSDFWSPNGFNGSDLAAVKLALPRNINTIISPVCSIFHYHGYTTSDANPVRIFGLQLDLTFDLHNTLHASRR